MNCFIFQPFLYYNHGMSDKLTVLLLVIVLLAGVGFAAVAFFLGKNVGTNQKDSTSSIPAQSQAPLAVTPSQEPSAPAQSHLHSPTSSSSPESSQTTDVKPGWLTYANSQYGFSISYPEDYKALSDQNNLYGWPNGLVLFYKGGQSYDIAVEV